MKEYRRGYRDGYRAAMKDADISRMYPYNLIYAIEGDDIDYEITPSQFAKCINEHLTEREILILTIRFRLYMTMEETGERFGISKQRIKQIEERAFSKLKGKIRNYRVIPYVEEI